MLDQAIPVVVVGGFLGSGKTTLVNHILNGDHGLKIAVMVNDFGDINIDADLITNANQNVVNLRNGCICCSLETDLIEQLVKLTSAPTPRPDCILIETSGVSDPARVLGTLRYPQFSQRLRLDNAITLVDAEHLPRLEGANRDLAKAQLTDARLIVINKADRVSPAAIEQLRKQWLFPDSRCYVTQMAQVPLALLFDTEVDLSVYDQNPESRAEIHHGFVQWSWQSERPFSLAKLRQVLAGLPNSIYRAKGILRIADIPEHSVVLNMVGHDSTLQKGKPWSGQGSSRLVMIATGSTTDFTAVETALDQALAKE